MADSSELTNLFEEFWDWRLKEFPEFATQIGIHDYDDQLDSYGIDSLKKRKSKCMKFLKLALALKQDIKDENHYFNLQLFIEDLKTFINGADFKGYLFPVNYLEGVHVDFERLISWMRFNDAKDYKKLLARYAAFPKQIEEIISLLTQAVSDGLVNHEVSMKDVKKQLTRFEVPAEETDFYKPFTNFPDCIDEEAREELTLQGKTAIQTLVQPSYEKLLFFLENEYMNHLRPNIACSSLPNGKEFYKQCLKFHLSVDVEPEEVHQLGLTEIARIEAEMEKIIKEIGEEKTVKDFWEELRKNQCFYCKTKDQLLDGFKDLVENKIRPLIPRIVKNIPKMELKIESYSSAVPNAPAAYYLAGSFDGSRPGCFYVNTSLVSSQPTYEMITLSLHEAEPGHHTQSSFAIEQPNVPEFRRFMEDRKYYECPSRFPIYTAYVEGWGLYSETLGNELGLYDDPYARFGHCSAEIFRACRLVVDTGMHFFDWSREKAIEFMKNHSAASLQNIENEINRYITWPGQACAYKFGEIKLMQFRKKCEAQLGEKFNLCDFHEVVLKFGGPLSLLEKSVDDYILNLQNGNR